MAISEIQSHECPQWELRLPRAVAAKLLPRDSEDDQRSKDIFQEGQREIELRG